MLFDHCSSEHVVAFEEIAPGMIAYGRGSFGRADDVGEEDGGECPVGVGRGVEAAQELFYLAQCLCRWLVEE